LLLIVQKTKKSIENHSKFHLEQSKAMVFMPKLQNLEAKQTELVLKDEISKQSELCKLRIFAKFI